MDGVEEREVKMAVPNGFIMPELTEIGGVTVRDRGDTLLHAVYWDTDDLGLARCGVGVRHRNGVWTFKGRSRREGNAVVREELELDGDPDRLPEPIELRVARLVAAAEVHPVAELRSIRHAVDVSAARASAEVVHDRCSVRDGADECARFEEVEVEYAPASAALAERIVELLGTYGARVEATAKYVRALRLLGHDPPEVTG
ncbi:MAG TPA: CYTH domain-containing protein [Candidatus Dormibacteraeota bacterium]